MTEKYSKKGTIFCIIFTLFYGVSPKNINGATNGNVTLQPLVEGEIEDILWKHEGNKMVEWDKQTQTITEYLKFKGRTKLDVKTGDVTLVNLAKGDTGLYDAEIVIRGRLMSIQHTLKVIDPVTETKITCQSNATMTTLHCEAEGDFLSYSWSGPGLQTAEMKGQTGPQISEEKDKDSVYTCVVNNPVSENSVTYTYSYCSTGVPIQLEGSILLIGCLVGAVVVAVALALLCWYYWKKRPGCRSKHNHENESPDQNLPSESHQAEENQLLKTDDQENTSQDASRGNMPTPPKQGFVQQKVQNINTFCHPNPENVGEPGGPEHTNYSSKATSNFEEDKVQSTVTLQETFGLETTELSAKQGERQGQESELQPPELSLLETNDQNNTSEEASAEVMQTQPKQRLVQQRVQNINTFCHPNPENVGEPGGPEHTNYSSKATSNFEEDKVQSTVTLQETFGLETTELSAKQGERQGQESELQPPELSLLETNDQNNTSEEASAEVMQTQPKQRLVQQRVQNINTFCHPNPENVGEPGGPEHTNYSSKATSNFEEDKVQSTVTLQETFGLETTELSAKQGERQGQESELQPPELSLLETNDQNNTSEEASAEVMQTQPKQRLVQQRVQNINTFCHPNPENVGEPEKINLTFTPKIK